MMEPSQNPKIEYMGTRCLIAGGGPAGIMLGLLLARAGIQVMVLEKHPDFFRDFRGDTIHPSTLELMHQLGFLEEFLKLPHQKARQMNMTFDGRSIPLADFSMLKTRCPFIAFMPQWNFLNFLARQAHQYPAFSVQMGIEVTDLVTCKQRVIGVKAKRGETEIRVSAELVIGADGRHSVLRERSGLKVTERGAPIDVLWFRMSKGLGDPEQSSGYLSGNKMMVLLDRGRYWQCGFVIPKGAYDEIRQKNLEAFHADIAAVAPFLSGRLKEINHWEHVKLLTVKIDCLRQWCRPGFLMIGDAAHAMSPVGGVGVNLAIQDAVAAANVLVPKLKKGMVSLEDLQRVQKRREWVIRTTQMMQSMIQEQLFVKTLKSGGRRSLPWVIAMAEKFPWIRAWTARAIGVGFCPERIRYAEPSAELSSSDNVPVSD